MLEPGAKGRFMVTRDEQEHASPKSTSIGAKLKRWAPILVLVVVMPVGLSFGWHEHLSLSEIIRNQQVLQGWVASNPVLVGLAFLLIYVGAVAVSFPGASFITIAGGFMFGWLAGGLIAVVGAATGATILFLAARTSVGAALKERAGPFVDKMASGFRENAFSYLLFLRLTPVFPFWLVNIAPALFNVSLPVYLGATLIGIIPGTFAYAFVGAGLGSVIEAQEALNPGCGAAGTCEVELSALVTPELIWALVALGAVALIAPVVGIMRKRRRSANGAK
ncbi:TVP38/TMEM64 family protein [Pseudovibrio sp. SPO723]|uniref:TVP38/TMEM64 family protein n=1 Tax=Nesiotobacter zosterae TaxID=392721 RepID=UPI0029C2EA18|nr:TVP38/TMEM64 family protein [Pseudovibrio sp. SPO723]MDX5592400.1 TVP38/TMEM64 family protein [Pseudovibrio sp. SPO723]